MSLTHHEALTIALAWFCVDKSALDPDVDFDEVADRLNELAQMFEPYKGDTLNAQGIAWRKPIPVKCSNCGLTQPRMFTNTGLNKAATFAQRGAFCPRCFATEGIQIAWDADKDTLPTSYEVRVKDVGFTRQPGTLTYETRIALHPFGSHDTLEEAVDKFKRATSLTITAHIDKTVKGPKA